MNQDQKLDKLKAIAQQYEMKPELIQKLRQLEDYDICLVLDDSGSMATVLKSNSADPYAKSMTRWDEMKQAAIIVTEVASCLDADGVDVFFLNRPPIRGVSSANQITVAFQNPPQGFTPTTRAIQYVFQEKAAVIRERKLLIVLITDGEPTDDVGNVAIREFVSLMKNRNKNVHVSIVACTDDDGAMKYLDKLDGQDRTLDVTDDYKSELAQIRKAKGNSFRFTFGDYVAKTLLGPVDTSMDNLDKKKCLMM
jgi:von Willebrand factor type A domain